MPAIERRTFLRWLAAASALPLLPSGCAGDDSERTFPQGVASGDPTPDGVLLWTRLEPAGGRERVAYEIAADPDFRRLEGSGVVEVGGETDHTLRVVVTGLAAATTYWYRFTARGVTSPIGRTRTAPDPEADVPVRIALASCQDYGGRWFHAWRTLVERDDVDFVLFIGDYIYESIGHLAAKLPADRTPVIPDGLELDDPLKGRIAALTLADYRALYRQYRTDPDLRAMHARFPFVAMWDDHEFANDCWQDHATDFDDARGDEAEPDRRAAASRAFFEYVPVRPPFHAGAASPHDLQLYRSVRWGKHAEFVLLDERYYRDDDVIPEGPVDASVGHIMMNSAFGARAFVIKDAFDRREAAKLPTMLGAAQRGWAIDALHASTATWKVLTSPLTMAQMVLDLTGFTQLPAQFRQRFYFKTDQWDGYRSERRALLEACSDLEELVVLSGDLHGFYASTLYADFDAPGEPVAPEYVVSAISAATVDAQLEAIVDGTALLKALGLAELIPGYDANLLATNPHIAYAESTRNGLAIVDLGPDAVEVELVLAGDVTTPAQGPTESVAFRTPRGWRAARQPAIARLPG